MENDYCDLPEPLRPVALSCDRIIQDDREFNFYLVELVYLGLRPSYAMWLFCRRFGLSEFVIGDLTLTPLMADFMEWIRIQFLQDEDDLSERLAELVFAGTLRASQAVFAYCKHFGINEVTIVDRTRPGLGRSRVVQFFDLVVPSEFAAFLDVAERDRIAGRV